MKIQIENHSIDIKDKPIGLSFSAGIDSTLLLYLLAKQVTVDIHLFTVVVNDRSYNTMKYSADVLSYISSRFPDINLIQHNHLITDTSSGINRLFEMPNKYLREYKIIGTMFTGINAIPKKEDIDLGWPPKGSYEYNIRNPYANRSIKFQDNWYCPFTMLNKKNIAEIYCNENIEDLAKLTNSCSTDYEDFPCKKCFACKEKYWAFGYY